MQTPKFSEAEALEARKPKKPCPPGKRRGTVLEATEGMSPRGNETLRAVIGIVGPDGTEYRLVDVMSATPLGALKLRHFAVACDAEADFLAGHIEASQFIGREVMATVTTERKRGFAPRSVISDYAPVTGAVVTPLRSTAGLTMKTKKQNRRDATRAELECAARLAEIFGQFPYLAKDLGLTREKDSGDPGKTARRDKAMITRRKIAGIAFAGGASLALVGCAQSPAPLPVYYLEDFAPPASSPVVNLRSAG